MKFNEKFLTKDILIISDFDNDYTELEKDDEKKYLTKLFKQIGAYGVKVSIEEVSNEKELRKILGKYNKDSVIVFNWCERFNNTDGTETQITKIYEELGFIFTGGSTKTLELVSNKYRCIQLLQNAGIKVPESYFVKEDQIDSFDIDFSKKYMVKSNNLHASAGISLLNLLSTRVDFLAVAKGLTELTKSDIVVQKFIEGDEYTALVWGFDKPEVLPIIKLNFENKNIPNIFTHSAKFETQGEEYKDTVYSMLDKNDINYREIENTVLEAYKTLKMEDYARFDVRINNNDIYVIDYNSNPYVNMLSETDLCEVFICTNALGYNWGETVLKICEFAYLRNIK